jgi:hypothetical protein
MDQPAVALDMISRFLNEESFADLPLPKAGDITLTLALALTTMMVNGTNLNFS